MSRTHLLAQLPAYHSPAWLLGGHMQTIYAKLLSRAAPPYRRELLPDSTGEERVAYDFVDAPHADAPLVVLLHGLEGSSHSHYAIELMHAVRARHWHGVVAHFRGCGGVPSRLMYHSGDTAEVAHMLHILAQRYSVIYAVGVSLGGNVLAKYLGEQGQQGLTPIPRAAAMVSAPLNLPAAGKALQHGLTRLLYTRYFLRSLLPKVTPRSHLRIRSLADFDDAYTAPLHGFANKDDYYRRAAALPYLPYISIPTVLLNAQNDPFLPAPYLPQRQHISAHTLLLQPACGGHVGFVAKGGYGHLRWMPETVLQFFTLSPLLSG